MAQEQTEPDAPAIDDEAVAAYLRAHPDFFRRHRQLTTELEIPHDVAPAVSLVAYQLQLLRAEKEQLSAQLDDLLQVARDNDHVAEQLHRLGLELLAADDLDGRLMTLRESLRANFAADIVRVWLIGDELPQVNAEVVATTDPAVERREQLFPEGKPLVGQLEPDYLQLAFGDDAERIASAAIIPFGDGSMRGLIGIGSLEAERFSSDQGTVFLCRLADLIARALRCATP
jgi:uncharacterized protein YigA (DUF484 family)